MKNKKTIGIYSITCLPTNKVYVGQSRAIANRKWQHFNDLKKQKHCNSHLQNAFNKYGEENFSFTVLENCKLEELCIKEAHWIGVFKCNIARYGFNQKEVGELVPCSDSYRVACGDATKRRNVAKNGMWTIFNLQTGEWFESPSRKEYGMENKSYNYKKHYVAFRDWTLEDFKTHYEKYNYWQFCQNGVDHSVNFTDAKKVYAKNLTTGEILEFTSISGAGRSLGISARAISNVTNGRKLSTGGYTFSTTTEFPDESKMFKGNDFPVYILDKDGCRYYESRYNAASQEFTNDTHATSYIKDFIDSDRTYKGRRFFSTEPTEVDVVRAKYNLSPNEALTYKIIYENKSIQPKQLPSTSKTRNNQMKQKLISYNLITQCPTTFTISLTN